MIVIDEASDIDKATWGRLPSYIPLLNGSLAVWAHEAEPGERVIYYTGFIAMVKHPFHVAEQAWFLHQEKLITLCQRRIGPWKFDYIAIKLKGKER